MNFYRNIDKYISVQIGNIKLRCYKLFSLSYKPFVNLGGLANNDG